MSRRARNPVSDFNKLADDLHRMEKEEVEGGGSMGLAGLEYLVLPTDPQAAEIEDAICHQGGSYTYWAGLRADAELLLEELENEKKFWYANKSTEARQNQSFKSEIQLENFLISEHPKEWKEMVERIAHAKRRALFIKQVTKAWEQRSILLPSLARLAEREYRDTEKKVMVDDDVKRGRRRSEESSEDSGRRSSDSGRRSSDRRAPL